MKKIFAFFILVVLILSGCALEQEERAFEITDEEDIIESVSVFRNSSGLMGYISISVYKSDINQDELFETYVVSIEGSGIISSFIQCYDPATEKISCINKRMETDYDLVEYNDGLYIIAYEYGSIRNKETICIYKPALVDGELSLKEVSNSLEQEIIEYVLSDENK